MLLEKKLYEIVEVEGCTFRLRLLPENVIFKAHFPGFSVLPGVCIVRIVTELAEKTAQQSLALSEIRSIKYLDVISPNDCQEIDFTFDDFKMTDAGIVTKGKVSKDGKVFSKFHIIYNKAA